MYLIRRKEWFRNSAVRAQRDAFKPRDYPYRVLCRAGEVKFRMQQNIPWQPGFWPGTLVRYAPQDHMIELFEAHPVFQSVRMVRTLASSHDKTVNFAFVSAEEAMLFRLVRPEPGE